MAAGGKEEARPAHGQERVRYLMSEGVGSVCSESVLDFAKASVLQTSSIHLQLLLDVDRRVHGMRSGGRRAAAR